MKALIIILLTINCGLTFGQNYLWKELEGTFQTYGSEVIATSSGDIICFGTDSIPSNDGLLTHMYLTSRNTNGLVNWSISIAPSTIGIDGYLGVSIDNTSDGGFILGGAEVVGVGNACVVKVDANGTVEWYQLLNEGWIVKSIKQTNDGGYACVTESGIIYRLDSSGNTVWSVDLNLSATSEDLELSSSGDIIVSYNDLVSPTIIRGSVISYSDVGQLNWSFSDVDGTIYYGLTILPNDDIVVGGNGFDGVDASRLVKLTGAGTLIWANYLDIFLSAANFEREEIINVVSGSNGNIYAVARSTGHIYNMGMPTGVYEQMDNFLQFDVTGNLTLIDLGINWIQGSELNLGMAMTLDGGVVYTSYDLNELSLVKYFGELGVSNLKYTKMNCFPNPTQGGIQIEFGQELLNVTIEQIDIIGRVVNQMELESCSTTEFILKGESGHYILRCSSNGSSSTKRVEKR